MRSISGIATMLANYTITDDSQTPDYYAGWGRRPSMKRAQKEAQKNSKKALCLEDGFLRSVDFMPGKKNPPLSIIADKKGIYFDASKPSTLEDLLNTKEFTQEELERAQLCIEKIKSYTLSKYNNGLFYSKEALNMPTDKECILIIDQCYGDASLKYGRADQSSFDRMMRDAKNNHPDAILLIKTHPDVLAGRAKGYLKKYYTAPNVVVIDKNVNPHCLFTYVSAVYTATSLLGFEALFCGLGVHVYGSPFYAGWGACASEPLIERRTKIRTAVEIFHAAYIDYATYYNPYTDEQSDIETTIDLLHDLYLTRYQDDRPYHCVGFKRWKRAHVLPFLTRTSGPITFHDKEETAIKAATEDRGCIVIWASKETDTLTHHCQTSNIPILRMEDGFIRSVGLGSDLIKGASLVLDPYGIYYDPSRLSGLEYILSNHEFSDEELTRAAFIKNFILEKRISKYNSDNNALNTSQWPKDKEIILVPGQVDNDASIRRGAIGDVKSNYELIQAVRAKKPEAYIIFKPHPDVVSGNRKGYIPPKHALKHVDEIITGVSIQDVMQYVDSVHTMTSLVGFEALLAEKAVHCYGLPFYAGWGLTKDSVSIERRKRKLNVNQLIVGAILCYPSYLDWENLIPVQAEHTLRALSKSIQIKGKSSESKMSLYKFIRRQSSRLWSNIKYSILSYRL